jgi:hypothetical protein
MLLDAKADVNPKKLYSVLYSACTRFEPDSVTMLLDAGADPRNGLRSQESPLYTALTTPCPEDRLQEKAKTIDILLTAISSRERSIDEMECLRRFTLAAEAGSVLDVILEKYPKVLKYIDSQGETALYKAVAGMRADKVLWMVSAGANINCENLIFALFADYRMFQYVALRARDTLRVLLDAGVDLGVCDGTGRTAFMACFNVDESWDSDVSRSSDASLSVLIRDMAAAVLARGLSPSSVEGGTQPSSLPPTDH